MPGTVIYDADCGFCTACARWLAEHGTCEIRPWQGTDLAALGLTEAQVQQAAYWLDGSGRVTASGAGAIAEALKSCGRGWRLAGRVLGLRWLRPVTEPAYRWVARNRHRLPGSTDNCRMPPSG